MVLKSGIMKPFNYDSIIHPLLSIVIPAYNEEKRIANTIMETCNTMNSFSIPYEIIIVNDGSKDRTFEEASRIADSQNNVKVVNYSQNGGKGNAIKYGCKFITGDIVTFLEIMKKDNVDIVTGSKRHPLSKINYPSDRKVLSWFYHLIIKSLFNLPVNDTQLGLKLFKREVIDEVIPKILVKRYAYDVEILVLANRKGYKMVEAPVELNFRRKMSRINIRDIAKIANDTAAIFYRMYILRYYDRKPDDHDLQKFAKKGFFPVIDKNDDINNKHLGITQSNPSISIVIPMYNSSRAPGGAIFSPIKTARRDTEKTYRNLFITGSTGSKYAEGDLTGANSLLSGRYIIWKRL
jgi:glycosyltransferase involved in cell wall biosynthesis